MDLSAVKVLSARRMLKKAGIATNCGARGMSMCRSCVELK